MWSTVVVLQKKDMEIPMLLNFSLKGKPSFHVKFFRKMLKNSSSENPIGRERFNRKTVHKNYCYSNLWGKFLRLFIFQWMQVWLKRITPLREKCPNTEFFYRVNLRIQSEYKKIRTRKTPYLDTFHAVHYSVKLKFPAKILFWVLFRRKFVLGSFTSLFDNQYILF